MNKTPGTSTIAVIFHVVHEGETVGTGTNLSNSDIMDVYNDFVEDFSLTNTDQSQARTGLGFNPANPGINFCLATQDPLGVPLAETGVVRVQTTQTWFDSDNPSEVNAMKSAPLGSPIWDRDKYLNIWICDITNGASSGTAGYAYKPSTSFLPPSNIDGIVIDYNLGTGTDSDVTTHEIGHYLGLDHTWGGSGSCVLDDGFTDTPNTDGPSFNNANSCNFVLGQQNCPGVETQFENYMDYNLGCSVMYTTEQSNYMNLILSGIRSSLLLSPGCDPAGPPICSFNSSPVGPGPVIIPENGTVVFQDQSTGAPTSWTWTISGTQGTDWDFTGGTNANSQNPQVTFYNLGTYDVTLVATNSFGSCTGVVENSYVQVVAPAAGTGCDTLRNYALSESFAWYTSGGSWGYLGGHGEIFAGFPIDEWAEPYTAVSTAEVRRVVVPFALIEDVSGTGSVNFYVRDDNAGEPGNILATENVLLADINDFAWNTIDFTTPASVTGLFWVGMEIFYGGTQDTAVVYAANIGNRPAGVGTTNMREGATWYQTDTYYTGPGINLSLAWDVLLSNGPAPVADFQFSEAAVCPGGDIVVNASGSTNVTDYEWFQTDDPVTTIIDDNFTAGTTFNFAGPDGPYQIFLFADGSCMTDALVLPVTVYPAVNATLNIMNTTCGDNNGGVTISGPSGGSGTYLYSLDGVNFSTTFTYSNLPAGNYTAYIQTTGDACEGQIPFTIASSTPLSGSVTTAAGICPGGTATITASGGTGYTWYDGGSVIGTTATINVSPTVQTQYTVEITDGTCTDLQYSLVTVNPLPTVGAGTDFSVCDGNSATLNGTGAVSYTWDNSVTDGVSFIPASTLTYTVTGTDANGCQNTDQIVVSIDNLPTVSAGSDFAVCTGNSATLNGSGATSYTWDNSVTDGVAFTPASTTTYTVTGTDGNGCQNTDQIIVTVNALPTVDAGTDFAVCAGNSATLNGSGATSYTWDNGVSDGIAFTPASTTTYTVTGTDVNSCQNTDQVIVTVNALPSVSAGTNQTVCAGSSVTLSGSGATSYSWDNGITDGVAFTPGVTTTYTVTGTDGNGCQNTDAVLVTVNAAPITSNLAETCNGGNTAYTVTFDISGGTAPYNVTGGTGSLVGSTWTSTLITSGVSYSFTVTDFNGCTAAIVSGVQNCACTTNSGTMVTSPTITVCGTGAATATHNSDETFDIDDALEFYIHDGSSSTLGTTFGTNSAPTFSFGGGLVYGTTYYISAVVGNDLGGGIVDLADPCLSVANGTPVVWYDLPTVGAGTNQTVCSGTSVTISGSGAVSYAWDNGVTDGVAFTATSTTIYTVTGTDGNGCQNTDQVTINVNALPAVDAGTDHAVCNGTSTTLNGSGATSYTWDNGVTDGASFTPAVTNTYTVTGTDGNGCQNTDQITVTVNALPSVSAGTDQAVCNGNSVTLNGSGASTYTWDNSVTDGLAFSPGATNTYTVTGTDGNSCQNTDQVVVTVNALPTVDAGTDQTACNGAPVTLAGSGAASYTWDNGVTDGVSFTPSATTTYTVTGTDVPLQTA